MKQKPKYHPASNLFPLLGGQEFEALVEDIQRHGLREPITVHPDGRVLDGRNRLRACEVLGIEPKYRTWDGKGTEIAYVISLNLQRRHLRPHEWGAAFKKLLEERGVKTTRGPKFEEGNSATIAEIAKKVGVPERTARQRLEQANIYASLPPAERVAVDAAKKSIASASRKIKQDEKRKEAAEIAEIKGLFSVIYADPPWRYGASTVTGGADQHYATMPTEEICGLDLKAHVTPDAALFLWVTNPLLPDGIEVIEAWGFSYKTNIVWIKDKATSGLGEYVRGKHELLLIATRGSFIPEKSARPESVIEAPRADHSRKPELIYELIERMYPRQRYLEVFARKQRKNWVAYGAEIKAASQDQ